MASASCIEATAESVNGSDVDSFLLTSCSELSSEEDDDEDEEEEETGDGADADDAHTERRKGPNWKTRKSEEGEGSGDAGADTAAENEDEDEDYDEDWKLVLVVRTDIGMSAGKIAAQVGHAVHRNVRKAACWNLGKRVRRKMENAQARQAQEVFQSEERKRCEAQPGTEDADKPFPEQNIYEDLDVLRKWEQGGGCKKITLAAKSFEEIKQIRRNAIRMGVLTGLVCDAGHTELEPGTFTVLGVGPAKSEDINRLTGHLKTFKGEDSSEGSELKGAKKEMKALKKEMTKEIECKNAEIKRLQKELAKIKEEKKVVRELRIKVKEYQDGAEPVRKS